MSKKLKRIKLNKAEIQSNKSRVDWAEDLITQLPATLQGSRSWLLNYGKGEEAQELRRMVGLKFDKKTQSGKLRGDNAQLRVEVEEAKDPLLYPQVTVDSLREMFGLPPFPKKEYTAENLEQVDSILKEEKEELKQTGEKLGQKYDGVEKTKPRYQPDPIALSLFHYFMDTIPKDSEPTDIAKTLILDYNNWHNEKNQFSGNADSFFDYLYANFQK